MVIERIRGHSTTQQMGGIRSILRPERASRSPSGGRGGSSNLPGGTLINGWLGSKLGFSGGFQNRLGITNPQHFRNN